MSGQPRYLNRAMRRAAAQKAARQGTRHHRLGFFAGRAGRRTGQPPHFVAALVAAAAARLERYDALMTRVLTRDMSAAQLAREQRRAWRQAGTPR